MAIVANEVGGILFASEHRQSEFVNEGVPQFVETHEQHVADHELDHVHLLRLGHALEALVLAELADAVAHLSAWRRGGRRRGDEGAVCDGVVCDGQGDEGAGCANPGTTAHIDTTSSAAMRRQAAASGRSDEDCDNVRHERSHEDDAPARG